MYVQPSKQLKAQITTLVGVGGDFNAALLSLYKNNVFPNKFSAVADFTVLTEGGLPATTAIVWGTAFVNDTGAGEAVAALISYLTSIDTDLPVTAYGYFIKSVAGDLLLAERFANPVNFVRIGQFFGMLPRIVEDS